MFLIFRNQDCMKPIIMYHNHVLANTTYSCGEEIVIFSFLVSEGNFESKIQNSECLVGCVENVI